MSDPLDQLKQWRETTDDATPGEWWGARGLPDVFAGPGLSSDIAVATDVRQPDSKFIVLAHSAMPALLTAVENMLKLHRINQPEDGDCQGYTEIGYGYLSKWCVECSGQSGLEYGTEWPCQTVKAIHDALGGAK